jgi:hypothetical protein
MIHFVDQHRINCNLIEEKNFDDMDNFEKENCINNNNSKMKIHGMGNFDGVQMDNPNWNFSRSYNNNMELSGRNMMNASTNFLNSTGENLSEFLSDCQKLILLSAFIASELPQRYDSVIFRAAKRTSISSKVITFL